MKKKKQLFLSVFLFVCLILSMSCMASAGWQNANGARYYYKNNKMVTGLQTISKKKYLFKSTGQLITNQVTYYNKKLYVSTSDGSLLTKWGKFKNRYYYGTSKGYVKTGLQTYKSNYYYFDPKSGAMIKNTWKDVGKYRYYFQSSGKAVKNKITTINKQKYYFNSKGQMQKGIMRVGKYYYGWGRTTGKMQKGSIKWGNYYYYFNTSTGRALTNAWKTLNGKRYHYDSQGRRQTGWLVLSGKKYYLDPKAKGAMATGTKKIDGKTYKFGSKGYVTYHSSGNIVLRVNRKKCVVTAYDNGVPIKAMLCSVGRRGHETPTGVFTIRDHLNWWVLDGPSWGQYCSHFLDSYLFHSVPMHTTSRDPYKVEANDYNCLGNPASGGCVRLSVADAKWICNNVPIGSTVIISDSQPTPLGKPKLTKMPKRSVGADPTDDFKNPSGYDVRIK